MSLKSELLEILACPQCKKGVVENADRTLLRCEACQLSFPVKDGIPAMLLDGVEKNK